MFVDGNIEVWLETDSRNGALITPYIRSEVQQTIQYRLQASKDGHSGRSRITQSGTVITKPASPIALGTISISRNPEDSCSIELSLGEGGVLLATFHLPCPR